MEQKPDYRFECRILDETTGQTVIAASTRFNLINSYGQSESIDMEVGSMLRAFDGKIRARYEHNNYQPNDSQHVDADPA